MKISIDFKDINQDETEKIINIFSRILSYLSMQQGDIEDIAKTLTKEGITIPFPALVEATGIRDYEGIMKIIKKALRVQIKIFKESGTLSTGLISEYLIVNCEDVNVVNIEFPPTIAKLLAKFGGK